MGKIAASMYAARRVRQITQLALVGAKLHQRLVDHMGHGDETTPEWRMRAREIELAMTLANPWGGPESRRRKA